MLQVKSASSGSRHTVDMTDSSVEGRGQVLDDVIASDSNVESGVAISLEVATTVAEQVQQEEGPIESEEMAEDVEVQVS